MKDFTQLKATLNALSELQDYILERVERCERYLKDAEEEFQRYRVEQTDDYTNYFYNDKETGERDSDKWNYKYARDAVKGYKDDVESYKAILKHLDTFKL